MTEPCCLGIDTGYAHPAWGVVGGAPPHEVRGWGMLDASDPVAALEGLLRIYTPDVVALETIDRVRLVRGTISATHALSLYKTGRVTGRLELAAARALDGGADGVDSFSAEAWRRELLSKPNPDEHEIERVLRAKLAGFPAPLKSNAHTRDALGVALFGLLRFRAQHVARAS